MNHLITYNLIIIRMTNTQVAIIIAAVWVKLQKIELILETLVITIVKT